PGQGPELPALAGLGAAGVAEPSRPSLDPAPMPAPDARSRLALAAALVEVGLRLQGLGGPAAPPAALLMGDLCLARSSRILTDSASKPMQIAFARAVEELSGAAASRVEGRPVRELLMHAL